ncbi:hypothetical protein ACFQJC_14475 [Haloferax namakaokahaiae]|uniref:Uncharacterized protein n=1 Tax=Haloferax namakaokahaiae TaxID=1748331 RepID=A0ABD5ZHJ6_9EURY
MADVRIAGVEFDNPGFSGSPTSVTVKVNNRELMGPVGFGEVTCAGGLTNDGHAVEVTLTIKDALTGTPVWSRTKDGCARAEDWDNTLRLEFLPVLDAGDYTLQASLQVKGDNGSDTGSVRSLTVTGDAADVPGSDTSGSSFDFSQWTGSADGDGNSDGPSFNFDPLGDLPSGNVVLAVIVLLLLAWLADSGAQVFRE